MSWLVTVSLLRFLKEFSVRNDAKYWSADAQVSRKQGSYRKAPAGASFAKDSKTVNYGKTIDLKDVECKKGHYANKCPDAKPKDQSQAARSPINR